jgi:hypothetical protein
MARTPQLRDFAAVHGLRCITIADLVRYRLRHDALVERSTMAPLSTRCAWAQSLATWASRFSRAQGNGHVTTGKWSCNEPVCTQLRSCNASGTVASLQSRLSLAWLAVSCCRYGHFTAYAYRSVLDGTEHVALVAGQVADAEGVLTRVHSESMLGDLFGAAFCESGSQLDGALEAIAAHGQGVLVYLRGQQGRGLGLADELRAHADAGACASPAEVEDAAFPVSCYCHSPAWHEGGAAGRHS